MPRSVDREVPLVKWLKLMRLKTAAQLYDLALDMTLDESSGQGTATRFQFGSNEFWVWQVSTAFPNRKVRF
jgi:hypothetical protein